MNILLLKSQLVLLKLKKRRAIAPLVILGVGVALKVADVLLTRRKKK